MKKFSDYEGNEAIELWADLLEPLSRIVMDDRVIDAYRSKKPVVVAAKEILKEHSEDATAILLRIDPTPLNGLNILTRLIAIISELTESEEFRDFFASAEQVKMELESSGSATENIQDTEA